LNNHAFNDKACYNNLIIPFLLTELLKEISMITIIADTTSGIPPQVAEQMGIPYLPQIIVFGDQTYRDDYEMDAKTLIQRMRESTILPKSTAPPPALYHPIFEKYASAGNTAIVLVPSADLSGTFRSAQVAVGDFPGCDIRVIDTRSVGSALSAIVFEAHKWAQEGLDADTIVARVKQMIERQKIYFVVDTLESLYKGGRIGGAKMLMGSLLQMKPILQLIDGRTEPFENQRTKRKAVARMVELVSYDCPHNDNSFVAIMHGDAEAEAIELAENLKSVLGVTMVKIYDLSPVVLVHSGPGVIAVSYFVEGAS